MHNISTFLREDRQYFANCKRSIAAHNNRMLFDGCICYAFILAFYTVLSIVTPQPTLLKRMYYTFDAVHLCLCIAVFTRPAKWKESFRATQCFSTALELSILSFFALEGAFVTPTQHSLYVPIAILLVQLLFIHRAPYSFLVIFLYAASFALLSYISKTPEASTNDIYIALATFLSANIGYLLIAQIRRSEQKALTKYETLSTMDELTGLMNKATVTKLCKEYILDGDKPCTLLIVDLDDFKEVNDDYGHEIGDEVLSAVGATIKHFFRANDITGRFGGDEFIVLLDACDDRAVVQNRVDAFRHMIEKLTFSVPLLTVRCCAGATFKREGDDFHSMFARADRALYAAKHAGKDRLALEDEPSESLSEP